MAAVDASITDWLQLSQSLSQTEAIWWQVWIAVSMLVIAVFMSVVAAVQACLFVRQLKLMVRLNDMTDLQQRSVFHPELRIKNFQLWPMGGAEGDEVVFVVGAEFMVRVHAVNIGGSNAYLCDETGNGAMAFFHSKKVLPMFKPWKQQGSLSRLIKRDQTRGYASSEPAVELAPGEFGFWQFECKVLEDFANKDLYVLGLIAYWDEGASKRGNKARRRLITFAKFFSEEDQVFLSPDAEKNPDYNYVE